MTIEIFLQYEVRSSRITPYLSTDCMRRIAGRYFAWKTRRKVARFERSLKIAKILDSEMSNAYKYREIKKIGK
jgi:hypothetical protein